MLEMILFIIVFVLFCAGTVILQVFLSKRKNRFFGLILPIVCFVFSVMTVLGMAAYTIVGTTSSSQVVVTGEDGTKYVESAPAQETALTDTSGNWIACIPVFFVTNIPTVVLLLIYFGCREKQKINSQIKRMNINDLS